MTPGVVPVSALADLSKPSCAVIQPESGIRAVPAVDLVRRSELIVRSESCCLTVLMPIRAEQAEACWTS